MATTVNTVWYANFGNGTSTGYYAVTPWVANSGSLASGVLRRQLTTPAVNSERVFVNIASPGGGTNLSEPSWVITKGGKTADGSVIWQECTGQAAVNGDNVNTPLSSANRSGGQVLGNIIQNNAGTHYFICSTAGTTGSGEPSYTLTAGVATTDSSCTWTCIGPVSNFTTAWGAPFARIGAAMAIGWGGNVNHTIYVSSIHAETQSASNNLGAPGGPGCIICCVSNTGNIPPIAANITTGASVSLSSGASTLTISGFADFNGIAFNVASVNMTINLNGPGIRLINCQINITSSNTQGLALSGKVQLTNTPISASRNVFSWVVTTGGVLIWRNTTAAISLPGGSPTSMITCGNAAQIVFEGVDLSGFSGTYLLNPNSQLLVALLSGCKLPSSGTVLNYANGTSATLDLIGCDGVGGATYRNERWWYEGSHTTTISAVRTGGASDGTTAIAWQVTAIASYSAWGASFECLPIAIWNANIGGTINVTIECCGISAAAVTNANIWLEVSYLGTSGSTLLSRVSGGPATPVLGVTANPTSTAAWDSAAPARANSTAYVSTASAPSMITISGNAGRLFVCTTSGTSSSSQPAGYASAVDGSVITDGTATFTAVRRFQLTVTLSSPAPVSAGYLHAYVHALSGGTNNAVYYVDPKLTLS